MGKTAEKELHFSIEGEFFTDLVRRILCEGDWRKAKTMIVEGLIGITEEQALLVLKGKAKFEGVNHLELVEDDQEQAIRERAREWNCGLFYEDRRWWKTYGYAEYFGYENEMFARKCAPHGVYPPHIGAKKDEYVLPWAEWRARYYAHNPNTDLLWLSEDRSMWVYAEPADYDMPEWLEDVFTRDTTGIGIPVDWEYRPSLGENTAEDVRKRTVPEVYLAEEIPDEDLTDTEYEARKEAACQEIRDRIVKQAETHGWVTIKDDDDDEGKEWSVPLAALSRWKARHNLCLGQGHHLPWEPVSWQGIKMNFDDPVHTDLQIAAGLNPFLDAGYEGESQAFNHALFSYFHEDLADGEEFMILSGPTTGKMPVRAVYVEEVEGPDDIPACCLLVLPTAGVKYDLHAKTCWEKAGAVICKEGSRAAHLAKVARERGQEAVLLTSPYDFMHRGMMVLNFDTRRFERSTMGD